MSDEVGTTYTQSEYQKGAAIADAFIDRGAVGGGGGGSGLSQAQTTAAVKTAVETATNLDQLETKLDAIATQTTLAAIDAKVPNLASGRIPVGNNSVSGRQFQAITTNGGNWLIGDILTRITIVDTVSSSISFIWQSASGANLGVFPVVGIDVISVENVTQTGGSTSALQTTGNTLLGSIDNKLESKLGNILPTPSDPALVVSLRDSVFLPRKASTTGFLSVASTNLNLLDGSGAGVVTDVRNWQSGKLIVVSTATTGSYIVQGAYDLGFTVGVHTVQLFESTAQNVNPINAAITTTNATRTFDLNLQGINFIRVNMTTGAAGVRPHLVVSQSSFVPLQTNVQQATGANLNAAISSLPILSIVTTVAAVTTVATVNTVTAITNLGISAIALTAFRNTGITSTAIAVKASAGRVHGINIINPNASPVYLKIYNTLVGGTTVGSTTPFKVFFIPASDRFFIPVQLIAIANLSAAITIAAVTEVADSSSTAPGTALHVEIEYV